MRAKADVRLKEFWRSNERFADLVNAVVFEGEQVLKAQDLQEMDADTSGMVQIRDREIALNRMRDVVKKAAFGVEFAVFGVEAQMTVHYAMPLRTLLYDGLGYLKEYQQLADLHRGDARAMTQDEFLSRMRREDRLHPIVTIVMYYSEKSWDGPFCLRDMMVEMPEKIEKIFSDYRMNLVQIRESDRYQFHNEDVKTVFEIAREIYRGNFEGIRNKYGETLLSSELLAVIGAITDSEELISQAKEGEVQNMCTALENLKREGIQEGLQQGIQEGLQQKTQEIVCKLLKKGYSVEEIAVLLDMPQDVVKEACIHS